MAGGIIIAHQNACLRAVLAAELQRRRMRVEIWHTAYAAQVLALQAIFCANAVLLDLTLMDIPVLRVVQMLRRDISNPYIMVCAGAQDECLAHRAMELGANDCVTGLESREMERLFERMLPAGGQEERRSSERAEEALQHIFCTLGLSFSLNGYQYIRQALRLLVADADSAKNMGMLYCRVGEYYHCGARTVEHGIHYAVQLIWQQWSERGEAQGTCPGNKRFLHWLTEQSRPPCVSGPGGAVYLYDERWQSLIKRSAQPRWY